MMGNLNGAKRLSCGMPYIHHDSPMFHIFTNKRVSQPKKVLIEILGGCELSILYSFKQALLHYFVVTKFKQ